MKGKTMKLRYIFYGLTSGLLFGLSSCSLNYDLIDTYLGCDRRCDGYRYKGGI